jgi:hypothetical protein
MTDYFKDARVQFLFEFREYPVGAFFMGDVDVPECVQIQLEGPELDDLCVWDIGYIDRSKVGVPRSRTETAEFREGDNYLIVPLRAGVFPYFETGFPDGLFAVFHRGIYHA